MEDRATSKSNSPPEAMFTVGDGGSRKWVYADLPQGRFARARLFVYAVLMAIYLGAPWLTVGSQPFLRFDIPGRRYSIFGATFMATDLYLLVLFLLLAAVAMFLFSALLGRLWCGWACPQTVFLEGIFRRIERAIEGSPLKRRKLDCGLKNDSYLTKKFAKHFVFIAIAALLSLCFTAYFISPRASFGMLADGGESHRAAFIFALVIAVCTYWEFAWFQEQFCTFLCPYARFQSVMLDDHSLIVGYDPQRGEPRGALRPDRLQSTGDCIDCKRCVQVCPTGIDIRNGLQLECVSCTACIDACDAVMERIGKPRGLIRYDSLAGLMRKPRRLVRTRIVLYSAMLLLLLSVLTIRLAGREAMSLTVARAAGAPYMEQDDGKVRNMFSLHLTNTTDHAQIVSISVEGPTGIELLVPGQPFAIASGDRVTAEAFVLFAKTSIHAAETPFTFNLSTSKDTLSSATAVFLGSVSSSSH